MTTTTTVTLTEELHDMIDETSLWDVLNALEKACFDKSDGHEGWGKASEEIGKLQALAFTYKL